MLYYSVHKCTEYMNNNIQRVSRNKRFADLAATGEVVFHTGDLGNLWGIYNKNTLYTTIKRYFASELLYRITNSLYAIKDPKSIDPYLLGTKVLHTYTYVSCESVLFEHGVINQPPQSVTLVSSVSKNFKILNYYFKSRQMKDIFLFNDVGIEQKGSVRVATLERAICDMFYFNPKKYLDSTMVDWQKVREISEQVGYNIKIPKNI